MCVTNSVVISVCARYPRGRIPDSDSSSISSYLHSESTDSGVLRALQFLDKWQELSAAIKKEKVSCLLFTLHKGK